MRLVDNYFRHSTVALMETKSGGIALMETNIGFGTLLLLRDQSIHGLSTAFGEQNSGLSRNVVLILLQA